MMSCTVLRLESLAFVSRFRVNKKFHNQLNFVEGNYSSNIHIHESSLKKIHIHES